MKKRKRHSKPKYVYPAEFQAQVVRLLLCDKTFLLGYRKAIDPEYFTDGELAWIVECAVKVFDKGKAHPSPGSVLTLVRRDVPEGLDADEVEARTRRLYKRGAPLDSAFVRDEVVTFGRHQRLRRVIAESGTYLEDGAFDRFVLDVQEANVLTAEAQNPFYDYEKETAQRIDHYEESIKGAIPLGISSIDQHLHGGGLGPGEMGILMGLPGFHKTTILCNIGMAARSQGLSVFHATFEVSAVKTARRYDCRISHMTLGQMLLNRAKAKKRITKFNEAHDGTLKIQWWPGRSATMADLEQHLRWLLAHRGFKPDLLIADYVAKMKPIGTYDSRMSRMGLGEMYADFRSLCGSLGVPGWTAIQANRAAYQALKDEDQVLTEENAAESFDPIRDADVVLTINQTRDERREGELRLYAAKVRDDVSQWVERLRVDPSRYTVTPVGEGGPDKGDSLEGHEAARGPLAEPDEPPPPEIA